MVEKKDESTASFIQNQLHSVIASQRSTIESLRDALTRTHVPRTDFDEIFLRLEQSERLNVELRQQIEICQTKNVELENELDAANVRSTRLESELDDVKTKLSSTYEVLENACAKIDAERDEFEKSLKKIRRTTEGEMKKNSELHATTLAMQETYNAQRQALDVKTTELKLLEKRLNEQTEKATNRINKLAVKLEQEKFISREILQTSKTRTKK